MTPGPPGLSVRQAPRRGRLELAALAASLLLHAGVAVAAVVAVSMRGAEVGVGEMDAIEVLIVDGTPSRGGAAEEVDADDEPASEMPPARRQAQASSTAVEETPAALPDREGASQPASKADSDAAIYDSETAEIAVVDADAALPPPPAAKPADVHDVDKVAAAGEGEGDADASSVAVAEQRADDTAVQEDEETRGAGSASASATTPDGEDDEGGQGGESVDDLAASGEQLAAAPRAGNTPPRYPDQARRRGWEGRAVLEVEVTADGRPSAVRLADSSGYDVLDAAAIKAVRAWRFRPAERNGASVASVVRVPVRFTLEGR